ncbi:MAG: serine hydrolase domain-containing protein [Vicinamibacterales bacterium]
MRLAALLALLSVAAACSAPPPPTADDPTPQTLDEFRAAAAKVLEDTGVPGAALALVTVNGTEWAGGLGWADRDRRTPVTADTHFRAGSISKSFVALALVQLYEDGKLDLDARIADLLPEVAIDNPWAAAAPITVRHVLEHTAGFDDMHFNEVYVLDDAPDLPLAQVLGRNPASRRVRWRPGTRMSYSNPGYAVAGLLIEKVSGTPYDQFIQQRIFAPLEMWTSTFQLAPADDAALAQGYDAAQGPPVTRRRIYLRPAGALHTSAGELAHFVQALLGWGERPGGYVVDPEYLSNMEWPRTTLASRAGVRPGYGLGIFSTITLPYPVLGHNGGIDGFLSSYGYSPSRDVGYVVLVNSTHAPHAVTRLSSLALRYLKRDLEPPPRPARTVAVDVLRGYEGYYRDSSPRSGFMRPLQYLTDGRTVRLDGDHLVLSRDFGASEPLIAVEDTLFRREREIDASLAFTTDELGQAVLTGPGIYAERADRWPVTLLRLGLGLSVLVVVVAPLAASARWLRARRRGSRPATFAGLGLVWWAGAGLLALMAWAVAGAGVTALGIPSRRALLLYAATLAYPATAVAALALAAVGWWRGPRRAYAALAAAAGLGHAALALYLAAWGLIGLRTWLY